MGEVTRIAIGMVTRLERVIREVIKEKVDILVVFPLNMLAVFVMIGPASKILPALGFMHASFTLTILFYYGPKPNQKASC